MEYSQVILEMLERIKVLENKVKALEEASSGTAVQCPQRSDLRLEKVSDKYRGLAEHLLTSGAPKIALTYAQIEELLGFPLPSTAHKYKQSYWANTETHSYASSWLAVGYKARVDVDKDIVIFIKNLI